MYTNIVNALQKLINQAVYLSKSYARGTITDTPLNTDSFKPTDQGHFKTASKILRVISRYQLLYGGSHPPIFNNDSKFVQQIYARVAISEPVLMCLPAFPFKSPNTSRKVLGYLPDKAEEFALAHLNGLCEAIKDVYEFGAKLMIISDGLVYNDLLGVPDKHVWAYGEALRELAVRKGFSHIEFSRLKDFVNIDMPDKLDQITYVSNATNFRVALLSQFANANMDLPSRISKDEDICLTYRGYIKFLRTDLQDVYPVGEHRSKSQYKKGVEYIAKQMLRRGDAFARAVSSKFGNRLRLSIHPSTGENKLSISLLPTDTCFTTPWHGTIAFRIDGTVTTGHWVTFAEDENFELVSENGRPSFFRERSPLFSWAESQGGISCEPLYPAGLMIRPSAPGSLSVEDIDSSKVRELVQRNSPLILRGFSKTTNRDLFTEAAHRLGSPTPWKFGLVLEVKDRGADTRGLNNVLSAEWMPYHYDGLFKTIPHKGENGNERLISTPPRFQLFTSITESPKNTGFTLFATSTLIFKYLPLSLPLSYLHNLTWSVSTSSFNATVLRNLPLVTPHPETKKPCLRFHEPWPQEKTRFDATNVEIENAEESEERNSEAVCDALTELLHDRRVAYYHAWDKGDLLVSDNTLAMHTRSSFLAGCDRELWRIHFE